MTWCFVIYNTIPLYPFPSLGKHNYSFGKNDFFCRNIIMNKCNADCEEIPLIKRMNVKSCYSYHVIITRIIV